MEFAKLICDRPCECADSRNQKHGEPVARALPLAIQHLAGDGCPARSFLELDREINDCVLILIRRLSCPRGQATHTRGYGGPKAIKNDSWDSHAADRLLPQSRPDQELLNCGPKLREHAFLGQPYDVVAFHELRHFTVGNTAADCDH